MAKDYGETARRLVEYAGGKGNIKKAFHCMTRLRFNVKDKSLVEDKKMTSLPEVVGVNWHNDQCQIIIGNEVSAVFKAVEKLGVTTDNDETAEPAGKKGVFSVVVDSITGCMTPMIPALTAAGMMKVILTILNSSGLLTEASMTYQVLSLIGDAAFYFMPFLIAANAAKVFKVNQSLALIIAGVFLHPSFVNLVAGEAAIHFIGLPVTKVSYSYSVIPIILMVWIMSYIEKLADMVTPKMLKIIMHPTLVILISAPIALIVVGPLGSIAGDGLASAINFLSAKLGFLIVGILAAFFPFIVMTGMHHALTPIGLSAIATGGSDALIFVSQVCSNVAQSGASLAVAFKSKDKKMKQLASAAGISAVMGITEPALYGVTLKLKRPVVAAAIAAGIGGIVGGILQVSLYIAQNSIMAIPAFVGAKGMSNLIYGIIMIAVSFIAAFVLTVVIGFQDEEERISDENPVADSNEGNKSENTEKSAALPGMTRKNVAAPIKGKIVELEHVPDKTFADKVLGEGIAIMPEEGKVFAPVSGEVACVMDSKHAVALVSDEGLEILIHVGLETVELQGKYFTSHVENGTKVKEGDLLLEFDLNAIKKAGYKTVTPVIVTNSRNFVSVLPMPKEDDYVLSGDQLLKVL